MGNTQTKIYAKLDRVLPANITEWPKYCDSSVPKDHFALTRDREQFIHAIETVISQNGKFDLSEHDFRMLYSRRDNDRIVAQIVAMKAGVVTAKVSTDENGKDYVSAFKALRRHVERQLDLILLALPEASDADPAAASGSAAVATASRQDIRRANNVPADAPPTYGNVMKDERASYGARKS